MRDDSSKPKGNVAPTLNDLAPVPRTDATQVMDPLEGDTDSRPAVPTDRGLPPVPAPSTDLPPVDATATSLPEVPSASNPVPIEATATSLPEVPEANAVTAPRLKTAKPPAPPSSPELPFELTPLRVALAGGGLALLGLLVWLVWPLLTRPAKPQPVEWQDAPLPVATSPSKSAKPAPVKPPPAAPPPPANDQLSLDAKTHVIDPRALHAPDVALEPTHKYRLSLKVDDPKAGLVLARLEEKSGWGVLHAMATHHALQFGGVKTLRLHCEPGSEVKTDTSIALELEDLARKGKKQTLSVSPATQCYDFETARALELMPGESRRVQLGSDQAVKLGEQIPLRVAYRLQVPGDPTAWRFGVLEPGDDVLVTGPGARFAILDPWLGDNEGAVVLQVLPGDTDRRGLVKPDGDGTKFVPNRP